jgi:hypothetical protein
LTLFRGLHAKARSKFVIESDSSPHSKAAIHYRCNELFKKLIAWLQQHGVTDRKGFHALRKEYGSQVCDRHGLYAASRALRHASVTITAAHYLDKKSKVTSGLGASFSDKITSITTATTNNAEPIHQAN